MAAGAEYGKGEEVNAPYTDERTRHLEDENAKLRVQLVATTGQLRVTQATLAEYRRWAAEQQAALADVVASDWAGDDHG